MGQESVGDLEFSLGYVVKQVHSALRGAMEDGLRPMGLTVPQYACLELLSQNPGLSNSELARRAFVSRQSMNLVLRRLEERRLLERPDMAPSGRALPSVLTEQGQELVREAGVVVREAERALFAPLSVEAQGQIRADLAACIVQARAAGT